MKMEKEELISYLKENLSIKVVDIINSFNLIKRKKIQLCLGDEVISESTIDINTMF